MNLSEKELKLEKEYLNDTIKIIKDQISQLGQELYDKEEKIKEFQKFVWNSRTDLDPTEMKEIRNANELEVQLAMYRAKKFKSLYKSQRTPYFASIIFNQEKYYIGLTQVENEEKQQYIVYDWRAPISSLFYDYEIGHATYHAPSGNISGEITNKRQFKIENGMLKRVFDNNLNIDDDVLQEVLSQESNERMKNIVNTIQQEQNAIIRNTEDKNLIVQGIAGSGKTSVALHRIAFVLYKIENLTSQNVLIFSPNNVFTEYISNVLPELGEENTMQTTFHDFLNSSLKEYKSIESFTNFIEKYYKNEITNKKLITYKQSDKIIEDLDVYINTLLKNIEFTEGLENHDFEVSKETLNYWLKERFSKLLFLERIDAIAEKICNSYYNGKKTKYKNVKASLIKMLNRKIDYKEIWMDFFRSNEFLNSYQENLQEKEITKIKDKKQIGYEDACIMVYIKSKFQGFSYQGNIKQVVIDEAQDYNKLQYHILKNTFKKSSFTILGDINQTINPYYHYESLEELKEIFHENTKYLELKKTYRSTKEIIEFTNKILKLNHISAIRRENNKEVIKRKTDNADLSMLKKDIETLKRMYKSVAIITKTDEEAENIFEWGKKNLNTELSFLTANTKEFKKELVVVPSYVAKGLEFDAVIIYTKNENKYIYKEKYLYYVACTRAQHQLIIYNQNEEF